MQHQCRRGDLAEPLTPTRAMVGEADIRRCALHVGSAGDLGLGVGASGDLIERARPGECPALPH